jgi:putative membrane protein
MGREEPMGFWKGAMRLQGSATPLILRRVGLFGVLATLIYLLDKLLELSSQLDLDVGVAPYEVAGGALGLLLILRTNAGYERWWEARKLWGGIVNQCRNLALVALSYGPDDPHWRRGIVHRTAAFGHAARLSLRGERGGPEVAALLGEEYASRLAAAGHAPLAVAMEIGVMLRLACDQLGMDRFGFLQADRERSMLLDHLGGCERILKAPLPMAYAIQIRQFLILFLVTLPFALLAKIGWLTPFVTMLAAYPILSLDQIGIELQNPFSAKSLNHLPLDALCQTIQDNLLAMLEDQPALCEEVVAALRAPEWGDHKLRPVRE